MYSARMTGLHFPSFLSVNEQQQLGYLQELNSNEVDCEYFNSRAQNSSDISYSETEANGFVYYGNQQPSFSPASTSNLFMNDSPRRVEDTYFTDSGIPKPALRFSTTFERMECAGNIKEPTVDFPHRTANEDNNASKKSKLNHSMIEKKRRDKMKNYLQELASLVPMCRAIESSKLDKFTVLKLAMQHIKSSRLSSIHRNRKSIYEENRNCVATAEHLDNDNIERMNLLLKSTKSFTAVISCKGIFYFLSPSVLNILRVAESEAVGKSIYDLVHKSDVNRVKSALNFNTSNWGLQKGNKQSETSNRAFICRLRQGEITECEVSELQSAKIKSHETTKTAKKRMSKRRLNHQAKESYVEFICSGVVRSEPSAFIVPAHLSKHNIQASALCFVCVFRMLDDRKRVLSPNSLVNFNMKSPNNEQIDCGQANTPPIMRLGFLMRLDKTGNVLFAAEEVFEVMGITADMLKGTSFYQYVHRDDIFSLMESHKSAMNSPQGVISAIYRVRSPDGSYIHFQSTCYAMKDITVERNLLYIMYINKVVHDHYSPAQTYAVENNRHNQFHCPSQDITNTNVQKCHSNLKHAINVSALSKTANEMPRSPIISEISLDDDSPLTELLNGVTENSKMMGHGSGFSEIAFVPTAKSFGNYETHWEDVFSPEINRISSWKDCQQDPTFIECEKSSAGLYLFNESDVESKRDLLILEHPPPHANSKNIHSTIEHNRIRFENEDFCTASQLNNKNYGDVGKALPRINTSYFSELDCYAKDFSLTENASYSSLPLHQLIDNLTNVD